MSKQVDATATCAYCPTSFLVRLYRTIWVEYEDNRALVLSGKINMIKCPQCGSRWRAPFSLLCSNLQREFAAWYEPYHDPVIDKDICGYRKVLGPDHYLATAPRIADWQQFCELLLALEVKSRKHKEPSMWNKFGSLLRRQPTHRPEQQTNVIYAGGGPLSDMRQLGPILVKMMKMLAEEPGSNSQVRGDWRIIKEWLGCGDSNLSDDHLRLIGLAWQSYLVKSASPSKELEAPFSYFKKVAVAENIQTIEVPDEVRRVFDRMVATDAQMKAKARDSASAC